MKIRWITLALALSTLVACEKPKPAVKEQVHKEGDGHEHKKGDGHDHKEGDGHDHKEGDGHDHDKK